MFCSARCVRHFCAGLLLSVVTVSPSSAAVDLTQNLLSSRSTIVMDIKDFKKLHDEMPLPLRSIKKLMPTLSLVSNVVPSATLRVGLPRNFGKTQDPQKQEQPALIAQFPMIADFDLAAALELADEPLSPFELSIPQGVNLRPVGQLNDLFLAKTELDGQVYLLAASTPELLLAMARNTNQTEEPRRLNDGVMWLSMVIDPRDLPDNEAQAFSAPLRLEYDIITSEKELITKIYVNTREAASHFFNDNPKFAEESRHLPMVAGSGPLHLLLSWNNSFIRSDLTLQDLLKQYASLLTPEAVRNIEGYVSTAQQFMGVQWSDILDVLRGTVTLGIAGSVDSPWGAIPGVYLHLGGANEKLKSGLMESVKRLSVLEPQMKGIRSVEGGTWKGFATPADAPVKAALLSVSQGLVFTTLPPEELFSGTPQPSPAMTTMTTTPSVSSLGIDVASLQPLVRELWKQHGGAFLQSMEQQKNPVTQRDVQNFLTELFKWSDMIISASDDENGELRLIVNAKPPVIILENPLPPKQEPARAEALQTETPQSDTEQNDLKKQKP